MVSKIFLATLVAPLLVSAAPSKPSASELCPTVCMTLLSECGERYGGCAPHCKGDPMPSFPAPPCPTTTEASKVEKRDVEPEPTSTCPTLCLDGISDCGERFGGCFPHCPGDPFPSFSTSPCPTATATATSKVEKRQVDEEPEPTSTCPIVCIDGISKCGERFGGCVPHCKGEPWPTFSTSACPSTATPTATPHSGIAKRSEEEEKNCPDICIDAINDCGIRFGGCGPVCSLTLSTPPCPTATTATYLQPSNGNTLKVEAKPTPN